MTNGERLRSFNGDQVIAFMGEKEYKLVSKEMDLSNLQSWFDEDIDTRNIGIIRPFGNQARISESYYLNLFDKAAVIKVNGMNGSFEYEYDISTSNEVIVVKDTSMKYDIAELGLNESHFEVVLNVKLDPGHVIGTSFTAGQQIYVIDEKPVLPAVGGGWIHYCRLSTNDKEATYDPKFLRKDTRYEIITHRLGGEFSDQYAGITAFKTGRKMRCRFKLHNAVGVEAALTGMAGSINPFDGAVTSARNLQETLQAKAKEMGEYAVILNQSGLAPTATGNGVTLTGKGSFAPTLKLLVHAEHHKLVSNGVIFQKSGTISGQQGKVKLNEGLYWQMQRAYTIQYGEIGGITRSHLQEAAEYIFRANPDLPVRERRIHFEGGKFAVENVKAIFKDEIAAALRMGSAQYGTDRLLPQSPISGPMDALNFTIHQFASVEINGVGIVTVTEDPTLNRISRNGDRFVNGTLSGGYDYTAYSLIVKDVMNPVYSNNKQLPKGAEMLTGEEKAYADNNIFLIRPEQHMTYWGTERGRFSSETNAEIQSSSRYQLETYWIYSSVAGWIKDVTRMVVIELDQKARKGFNY